MRTILERKVRSGPSVDLVYVLEAVKPAADWSFTSPEHVLIVHRKGKLRSLETEFEGGLAARTLPSVGDVWAAPGGEKYSAIAREGVVRYCEVRFHGADFSRREMTPRIAHHDRFLHSLVERAAPLAERDDDLSGLLFASIAETARLHVAAAYFGDQRPQRHSFSDSQARFIRDLIDDNLEARHTSLSLANSVGMTESDFAAAFGAAFAASPHQYLIDRRIARARCLLRDTRLSLTEIAMRTGFSTPSHFSATFRTRIGVSPRDYRRLCG